MPTPRLILISGLSCSGKSTLAQNLANALDGEMIRIDDYYFETDPADFATTDFDDPTMIDVVHLANHLTQLKAGCSVDSPHYDFTECRYTAHRIVAPCPFLIVEGQYAALYPELTALADVTVFLDVPTQTCLERRICRDESTLHRARLDIEQRFQQKVAPAFEKHRPTIVQNCRLILTPAPQAEWQSQVLENLRN